MNATTAMAAIIPTLDEFREEARQWLAGNARPRDDQRSALLAPWGAGSDRVGIIHNLSPDEDRAAVARLQQWRRLRYDAGFGPISWPAEYGGRGYPPAYELAFAEEEARFVVPDRHEALGITMELIAPTICEWGTPEQKKRYLPPMLRGDVIWCQLFSEPDAGSDLAALRTRAVRDGDRWRINGQKVWTSGARHAEFGYLLARTDPQAPKHAGLTTFIVPMRDAGVEVRPLRQVSGGSSFSEVFFTDLSVPDEDRLGPLDSGWKVIITTLGFERVAGSGEGSDLMSRFDRVFRLARHLERDQDPVVRQELATLFTHARLLEVLNERVRLQLTATGVPGSEGSIAKLFYGQGLDHISEVVSLLLGPRLTADTGEWGTYAWMEHLTGALGSHIAGGTDEIQRNTIGERILGLPKEPKAQR